ncbi:hypothetical protein DL769_001748 [Monosporascus sp. CRB-8-3]|nr:hypothetical protein DL769_001748 [Monosporascus sp. CRB-8-3]
MQDSDDAEYYTILRHQHSSHALRLGPLASSGRDLPLATERIPLPRSTCIPLFVADGGSAAGAVRGAAPATPLEARFGQPFVPSDHQGVLCGSERIGDSGIKHYRVVECLGAMDVSSGLRGRWATRVGTTTTYGTASWVTGPANVWLEANRDPSRTVSEVPNPDWAHRVRVGNGDLYASIRYAVEYFSDGAKRRKNTSSFWKTSCGADPEFSHGGHTGHCIQKNGLVHRKLPGMQRPVTAKGHRNVRRQRGLRSGQNNSTSARTLAKIS